MKGSFLLGWVFLVCWGLAPTFCVDSFGISREMSRHTPNHTPTRQPEIRPTTPWVDIPEKSNLSSRPQILQPMLRAPVFADVAVGVGGVAGEGYEREGAVVLWADFDVASGDAVADRDMDDGVGFPEFLGDGFEWRPECVHCDSFFVWTISVHHVRWRRHAQKQTNTTTNQHHHPDIINQDKPNKRGRTWRKKKPAPTYG